jgi:hypothetical protein
MRERERERERTEAETDIIQMSTEAVGVSY